MNPLTQLSCRCIENSVWTFFTTLCRGNIENIEQFDALKSKPFMIMANHVSHLDWLVLYCLFYKVVKQPIVFIAKKELFESPVWRYVVDYGSCIRLDRSRITKDVIHQIHAAKNSRKAIGIFPEGTRSANGELLAPKSGTFKLAASLQLPIVPIGLCGFYQIMPKHSRLPRPSHCTIRIGTPITSHITLAPQYTSGDLEHQVMGAIARLCGNAYQYNSPSQLSTHTA